VHRPTLVLIRHARTEWNRQGRFNSTVDLPIDDGGRWAAQRVAASLSALEAPIIASPARRARETAAPLAAATGQQVEIDDRLAEVAFGRFEGRTPASLVDDPGFAQWRAGSDDMAEPAVGSSDDEPRPEPLAAAARRLCSFLEDAGERSTPHGTALVVGHGVAFRLLLCVGVLGLAPEAFGRLRLDNAHAAILTPRPNDEGYRLAACNVPADAVAPVLASHD
jgi:glucosyl-3-phosphoglycerate phosphatase